MFKIFSLDSSDFFYIFLRKYQLLYSQILGNNCVEVFLKPLTNLPLFYLQAIFLIVLSFLFYPLFEILET